MSAKKEEKKKQSEKHRCETRFEKQKNVKKNWVIILHIAKSPLEKKGRKEREEKRKERKKEKMFHKTFTGLVYRNAGRQPHIV